MKINSTGKQIQSIANLLCGLGWFASVFGGIVCFIADNILEGIIIIAVGFYTAWACTRILQGFGELIDETTAIRENTDRIVDILESQYMTGNGEPAVNTAPTTWICKKCRAKNPFDADRDVQFCRECGHRTRVVEEK